MTTIPEVILRELEEVLVERGLKLSFGSDYSTSCPFPIIKAILDLLENTFTGLSDAYQLALDKSNAAIEGFSTESKRSGPNEKRNLIQENLLFLCSVMNDSLRVEQRTAVDVPRGRSKDLLRMTSASATFFALRQSTLDVIVSLLFRSLHKKYFTNFGRLWFDSLGGPGPVDKLMQELCNNILYLRDHLENTCFAELLRSCLDRFVQHYFIFLNKAAENKNLFQDNEIQQVNLDIETVIEYFGTVVGDFNLPLPMASSSGAKGVESSGQSQVVDGIKPLELARILLEAPINSKEFVDSKRELAGNSLLSELYSSIPLLRLDKGIDVSDQGKRKKAGIFFAA